MTPWVIRLVLKNGRVISVWGDENHIHTQFNEVTRQAGGAAFVSGYTEPSMLILHNFLVERNEINAIVHGPHQEDS